MQHISIYDYLLLPLYLALFYILVKRRSLRFDDLELRKIFLIAFGLRMLGSIAYSLMVQYYYGYGDAFTYYEGGNFIIDQVKDNIGNIKYLFAPASELQRVYSLEFGNSGGVNGYIAADSSAAIMKASAMISILSFNRFLITSLFLGLFSFAGQWKLFQVFNDINKYRNQKLLAFAVLYTPAIWFWSSGLLKESICLGGLGFIINILYNSIVKKKGSPVNWVVLALLVYIVYVIKSYIIAILFVSIFFTVLFIFFQKIKIVLLRVVFTLLSLLILYFSLSLSDFSEQISELAEESVMQIETFQKNYQSVQTQDESSRAGFEMSTITPTFGGMLLKSPAVIFTCLFRPFVWESRKLIILLSSLESTLLLITVLFLLVKTRIFGFFRIVFSDPYVFFSFTLSILFATIIGFTTFNFGTMTRYKIMLLPFFYFMLVVIYTKVLEKKMPAAL
ncbi:MAG TPA: hypothetical protein PK678_14595 [Ferruginibacter sp.]|nr:hypothetical protein [Ferruginibacter sp.]